MKTSSILGYPVHIGDTEGFLKHLTSGLAQGKHQHIVTLNPEMLMAGEKTPAFGTLLKQAQLILPDGAGLVWALKRKKLAVKRMPGIEFGESLLNHAAQHNQSIALIGATPETNAATQENLLAKYPNLTVAYSHHGYFDSDKHTTQVAQACAEAAPHIVFVALGVPLQETWIQTHKERFTQPTLFMGVGGSFDIWSGTKQRAPAFFLDHQIEWLYRITTEPFRLKRVAITLPMFVVKVLLNDNEEAG